MDEEKAMFSFVHPCLRVSFKPYDWARGFRILTFMEGGAIMRIAEVSEQYDISADTLRYYERIGLLPRAHRNASGVRDYSDEDCVRISFVKCMRGANVSIEALIEYMQLFDQGDATYEERRQILIEQREIALEKLERVQEGLDRLDHKIAYYDELIAGRGARAEACPNQK